MSQRLQVLALCLLQRHIALEAQVPFTCGGEEGRRTLILSHIIENIDRLHTQVMRVRMYHSAPKKES